MKSIYYFKKTAFIITVFCIMSNSCGESDKKLQISSFTIDDHAIALNSTNYIIKKNIVYFSMPALEKHFGLTVKDISDKYIGVCQGENLCIEFEIGTEKPEQVIKVDTVYYVPFEYLMKTLSNITQWNPAEGTLKVTVTPPETASVAPLNVKKNRYN